MKNFNLSNLILNTDSYKYSHPDQYPSGTQYVYAYIEARDRSIYDRTVFFGLQAFIQEYLSKPITMADVEEAAELCKMHGVPFFADGWKYIVQTHGGKLPLDIRAVPEGTVINTSNALVTVVNTDPNCYWLTSFVETALLRAVWYPTTVATQSWHLKQILRQYLLKTSDTNANESVLFKLHDFGARGASSLETAALGGMAHLVNFMGTDTVSGLIAARNYYDAEMAGFSIPASEHSTITSWKRSGESAAYENMLAKFGGEGKLVAVVSDSYNIEHAVDAIWGQELKDKVLATKGTLVIRPDSGDPLVILPKLLASLWKNYGGEVNKKGYRVLNPAVRLIQGDGVNPTSIRQILTMMEINGFSADNIAFGMGGALLQSVNRDTLGFAMKTSAVRNKSMGSALDDYWYDVWKDPATSSSKRSKKGRFAVVPDNGAFTTVSLASAYRMSPNPDILRRVYCNGVTYVRDSFAVVRERSNQFV